MLKKIILILLTAAILNGCRSSKEINNASSEVDSATDINNSAYVEVTTSEIASNNSRLEECEIWPYSFLR